MAERLRLVFLGSGAFGLPTLEALAERHEIALVVSQPDRPAGRGRGLTPTPIAEWAGRNGLAIRKPADVNEPGETDAIRTLRPDALVVIAFGQKLGPGLLEGLFAINLHASLLPAYRGAAPINWALLDGCERTGVSVITVSDRMDAGDVLATASLAIDPFETAGELHDRLARLGPEVVLSALGAFASGSLSRTPQDERAATRARKLRKEDGLIDLATMDARAARCRIHGLSPWPGCAIAVADTPLRVLRARECPESGAPGTVLDEFRVACAQGSLELLEVQPIGGRPMSMKEWARGRRIAAGAAVTRLPRVPGS